MPDPLPTSAAEIEPEEDMWMKRMADGDSHALRPVFDRWKRPLLSFFYRALGSWSDAEDLTLQVFERVYFASGRYRSGGSFAAWLFAIARRELLHEWRRRRRKPVEPLPPDRLEHAAGEAPVSRNAAELDEKLLLALRTLPERERTALLMSTQHDMTHREIGHVLGLRENHIGVLLHRARRRLKLAYNKIR